MDVALVLDQSSDNMVEGSSLAPGRAERTPTKDAFIRELEELSDAKVPIGTLFIISRASIGSGILPDEGVLFFEPKKGKFQKVTLTELAASVRAALPNGMDARPTTIAFRGCRIGGKQPGKTSCVPTEGPVFTLEGRTAPAPCPPGETPVPDPDLVEV